MKRNPELSVSWLLAAGSYGGATNGNLNILPAGQHLVISQCLKELLHQLRSFPAAPALVAFDKWNLHGNWCRAEPSRVWPHCSTLAGMNYDPCRCALVKCRPHLAAASVTSAWTLVNFLAISWQLPAAAKWKPIQLPLIADQLNALKPAHILLTKVFHRLCIHLARSLQGRQVDRKLSPFPWKTERREKPLKYWKSFCAGRCTKEAEPSDIYFLPAS